MAGVGGQFHGLVVQFEVTNNAGNFKAGFFEEITPGDFRAQVETVLFGSVNVARAALPVMRSQRAGLLVQISSTAGVVGGEFTSAYAAAKFGVEGWFESLAPEVAPFGIRTLLVEPGFFRTELLSPESTDFADSSIDDYARRTKDTVAQWQSMNGKQGATRPSSRPLSSSSPDARIRRCGGQPALTPSARSSRRPSPCSPMPTPTATCRAISAATTPEHALLHHPAGRHRPAPLAAPSDLTGPRPHAIDIDSSDHHRRQQRQQSDRD